MNHTYSIMYNTKPGFVIRVALILERRGFDIESLIIAEAEMKGYSEMILKVKGSAEKSDQIIKQLSKLIDVIYVEEIKELEYARF
jgi:acetolactate synthase-1/3 small subunit